MKTTQTVFTTRMEVRSSECDMQGVVNNAVYQHYLEHARHRFLREVGFGFGELLKRGVNLTLARAEIRYVKSLRDEDEFSVKTTVVRQSPIRYLFNQVIETTDGTVVLEAKMTVITLNDANRPAKPPPYFSDKLDLVIGVTKEKYADD